MPAADAASEKAGESDDTIEDLSARAESENRALSERPCENSPAYEAELEGASESVAETADL